MCSLAALIQSQMIDESIDVLSVSWMGGSAAKKAGVKTIRDLTCITKAELRQGYWVGKKSVDELERALDRMGLKFAER